MLMKTQAYVSSSYVVDDVDVGGVVVVVGGGGGGVVDVVVDVDVAGAASLSMA